MSASRNAIRLGGRERGAQLSPLGEGKLIDSILLHTPPRSRLYNLEPVGLGTPYVESLSSYFARLAQAHSVSTISLFKWEILPLLNIIMSDEFNVGVGYYPSSRELSPGPVNSSFNLTSAWAQALTLLTKQKKLHLLTALPLGGSVSPHFLMKKTPAWCSSCCYEWQQTGKINYGPLLWSFSVVTICPFHKQLLRQICPHCAKQQRLLSPRGEPGYCFNCDGWLSSDINVATLSAHHPDSNQRDQQLRVADAVGELIGVIQAEQKPVKENTIHKILTLIDVVANGDDKAFSRFVVANNNLVSNWMSGRTNIRLDTLLKICFSFDINLARFLIAERWVPTSLRVSRGI